MCSAEPTLTAGTEFLTWVSAYRNAVGVTGLSWWPLYRCVGQDVVTVLIAVASVAVALERDGKESTESFSGERTRGPTWVPDGDVRR